MLALSVVSSAAPFDVPQAVIAGGGGAVVAGAYAVSGTVGQSVTGTSAGGAFTLNGGFWTATVGGGTAPTLQSVVSRRTHGAAGSFDLNLGVVAPMPTADPQQTPAPR